MEKNSIKSTIRSYLNGELSGKEQKDLLAWISQSKTNARIYAEEKDIWEYSKLGDFDSSLTDDDWNRFSGQIAQLEAVKKARLSTRVIWISSVAAVLVVAAVLSVLLSDLSGTEAEPFVASTTGGIVSQFNLPDGTLVFLNADSRLDYHWNVKEKLREVNLQGEGWFQVVHDPDRPFIVNTGFYKVKVLGTEFGVRAYPDSKAIETTLEKGSVRILSSDRLKLEQPVTLSPGEQMTYNTRARTYQVNEVNPQLYTSWKDDKLEFIRLNFKELVTLLEHRYRVDIEVLDKQIFNYHYSGTFKDETIDEILYLLEQTLPVTCQKKDSKIRINSLKQNL